MHVSVMMFRNALSTHLLPAVDISSRQERRMSRHNENEKKRMSRLIRFVISMFMIKFFCKTRSFEAPSQKVSTNVRHLSTSFLLVVEMEVLVDSFSSLLLSPLYLRTNN